MTFLRGTLLQEAGLMPDNFPRFPVPLKVDGPAPEGSPVLPGLAYG
jgi:hypothetical protein